MQREVRKQIKSKKIVDFHEGLQFDDNDPLWNKFLKRFAKAQKDWVHPGGLFSIPVSVYSFYLGINYFNNISFSVWASINHLLGLFMLTFFMMAITRDVINPLVTAYYTIEKEPEAMRILWKYLKLTKGFVIWCPPLFILFLILGLKNIA